MDGTICIYEIMPGVKMVHARRDGLYVAGTIKVCWNGEEVRKHVLHCREVLMAPYGQIADQCQHLFLVV